MKILLAFFGALAVFCIGLFVGRLLFFDDLVNDGKLCRNMRFDVRYGKLNDDPNYSINGNSDLLEVCSYYEIGGNKVYHGAVMRWDPKTKSKEYVIYCHGNKEGYVSELNWNDPPGD